MKIGYLGNILVAIAVFQIKLGVVGVRGVGAHGVLPNVSRAVDHNAAAPAARNRGFGCGVGVVLQHFAAKRTDGVVFTFDFNGVTHGGSFLVGLKAA